jgi:multidrug efflux pump subunit AcrA (membrane-fusion protein)
MPRKDTASLAQILRIAGAAALALAFLAACAHHASGGKRRGGGTFTPPPEAIPTAQARTTTVRPLITIAGIIAPLQNVAVTSALSEPADHVDVQEGDHVAKGQLLAQLDTADLRAQLANELSLAASDEAKVTETRYNAQLQYGQNPQQVNQQRQTLHQAQQTLEQDELNLTRDRQLVSSGYIAQQQYDEQATLVNNDRAAVRSAQSALQEAVVTQNVNGSPGQGLQQADIEDAIASAAAARASAQQTRVSIAKAAIVSPVDGVVANRNLNDGEYPGGRTLFVIQEISTVYAELNASSAQVFALRTGAPLSLTAAGAGSRVYHGHVVGVLGQVEPGSTNFTVKTIVENPDLSLQSGVPVTATVSLPSATGVGIPTTAFLDDTHTTIMIDQNGTAKSATVREVASDGTTSIVRGIAAGQSVIADGQLGVASGQKLSER